MLLQVLLTSDALEMTVGSCVSAPLAPEREERLRKMLNSVFTHPDSAVLVAPVAAGVIGLGQGLDSDAKDIVKVNAFSRGQGPLVCQWWLLLLLAQRVCGAVTGSLGGCTCWGCAWLLRAPRGAGSADAIALGLGL